jgi:hypothetical protein
MEVRKEFDTLIEMIDNKFRDMQFAWASFNQC